MEEPQKPFACTLPECGMSFTNEDRLHVHTKKHDMVLQLGIEQKNAFVADQTPTPTRFIRNCEEVGLFQDLQNVTVNPFDEGFKRAIESKQHHILSLDPPLGATDELHTPQVFPLIDSADASLYTSDGHVTISRSSSDEGKHCETKLTKSNHLTINRIGNIEKINDVTIVKNTELQTDTISYKNTVRIYNKETKDVTQGELVEKDGNKNDKPIIMSQQSIDCFVDSFINDGKDKISVKKDCNVKKKIIKNVSKRHMNWDNMDDYEVIIKLPNGKQKVMKAVDEKLNVKDVLRKNLTNKIKNNSPPAMPVDNNLKKHMIPIQLSTGTLIPVTLVTQDGKPITEMPKIPIINNNITKIPIPNLSSTFIPKIVLPNVNSVNNKKEPVIITRLNKKNCAINSEKNKHSVNKSTVCPETFTVLKNSTPSDTTSINNKRKTVSDEVINQDGNLSAEERIILEHSEITTDNIQAKKSKFGLQSRCAASKRYRIKVRESMRKQAQEIQQLKLDNERLMSEKAVLKLLITQHLRKCPLADDLRSTQEKIQEGCVSSCVIYN